MFYDHQISSQDPLLSLGLHLFKIWANPGLFFVYFHHFHITNQLQIEKSVDGVLGIQTQGRRMVDADETTELWRPPMYLLLN